MVKLADTVAEIMPEYFEQKIAPQKIAPLETRMAELEARVAELERTRVKWLGDDLLADKAYPEGTLIRFRGDLWHAHETTSGPPPGHGWTLWVRKRDLT